MAFQQRKCYNSQNYVQSSTTKSIVFKMPNQLNIQTKDEEIKKKKSKLKQHLVKIYRNYILSTFLMMLH